MSGVEEKDLCWKFRICCIGQSSERLFLKKEPSYKLRILKSVCLDFTLADIEIQLI